MKPFWLVLSFSVAASACPQRICSGDRIIDGANLVGTVREVFSNGKATVSLDYYSGRYMRSIADLGKGVRCQGRICVDNRILSGDKPGTVKEVFDNGKASVALDYYSGRYVRTLDSLGRGYRCLEGTCRGDRMIDSANHTGTIRELFDDGRASVSLDHYSGRYIRTLADLGIELRCELRRNCRCED